MNLSARHVNLFFFTVSSFFSNDLVATAEAEAHYAPEPGARQSLSLKK